MPAPLFRNSRLCWALGLSILGHLVLFFVHGREALPLPAERSGVLQAVLRSAPVAAPPQAAAAHQPEFPTSNSLNSVRQPKVVQPAPESAPLVAPRSDSPAPVAQELPGPQPSQVTRTGVEGGAEHQGRAVAAPVAVPMDADALREYRMALARAAREFRRYPALARERQWEGVAKVQLRWPKGPGEVQVRLMEGSGHAILDEQAVTMLQQAVRRTPMPEALRSQRLEMVLPVEFSLQQP